jgi:hypothetical protein
MELPPSPRAALRRLVGRLVPQPALITRVLADGHVERQPRRVLEMWAEDRAGASMMPARSDASASASESSICGKRSQTTRRRQAPRTIQVRCVRRRDIVARLADALVQAMTNICGNGHRPASDGSAAW